MNIIYAQGKTREPQKSSKVQIVGTFGFSMNIMYVLAKTREHAKNEKSWNI